ncbi:hypothetical protein [Siminovitchia terrae]|uniref:hypothetical protein n=1 Tax=Siminovitchia terrae TaxID=1914933 RepID=UPI001BB35D7A|nr:hypothetical protein [Siminovitchia terrae]
MLSRGNNFHTKFIELKLDKIWAQIRQGAFDKRKVIGKSCRNGGTYKHTNGICSLSVDTPRVFSFAKSVHCSTGVSA